MGKEIERKYKLQRFPNEEIERGDLAVLSRKTIHQTYLAYDGSQEIRIRKLVERELEEYTHTFKSGHGWSREEIEYSISSEIYGQLLQRLNRVPLEKIRITLQAEEHIIEIDEYLQFDLRTVEVEFGSEEEAKAFQPPVWFGDEVGGEEEYRNKKLWLDLQGK